VLAARLAVSIDRPDLGVWVARYAERDGTLMVPVGYPILQEIQEGEPERALLLAVGRQESNFNPRAISRAGARGIMQLMPATARTIARQHRIRYSQESLTGDAEYNIRLGRHYLASMLARFEGSYLLAVAAYNAGPTAVSRWVRRYGDPRSGADDPVDWIEMIPYGETRDYVQRVLGNLQVFRQRLRPGNVAMTLNGDLRR
jgi:soluble lytic murein transglycosylase